MFEPVHGSAPDIAGKGISNPVGSLVSGSLMLSHLGHEDEAERLRQAIDKVCGAGVRTRDVGGDADTQAVVEAVIAAL